MNIRIRLATIDDIPALQELIRGSVSVLGAQFYTSGQIASGLSHIFGVDTQLILDGTYFIAEAQSSQPDGSAGAVVEWQVAGSGGWSKRKTLFGGDQAKASRTDAASTTSFDVAANRLLNPTADAARIRAFYVHPKWSRKGIGSLLLEACEHAARNEGFRKIELAATLPGERLYLARGYQRMEALSLDTPDGESLPAFRMTKTL